MMPAPTAQEPNSVLAEQAVIGILLGRPELIHVVAQALKPEDFYAEPHKVIYAAMLEMSEAGEAADLIGVQDRLIQTRRLDKAGGSTYLGELAAAAPSGSAIDRYIALIRERATRRKVIRVADSIKEMAASGADLEQSTSVGIEELFRHLREGGTLKEPARVDALLIDVIQAIERRSEGKIHGIKTGFDDLDAKLVAMQPGDLVVIAGRPSMGKTSLGMQIAANAAMAGEPTMVFTLEMTRDQIAERWLAQIGGVDFSRIKTGLLYEEDYAGIAHAVSRLHEIPLFVDDTGGLTVQDIAARARARAITDGLSMIVIDYLQYMGYSGYATTRNDQIGEISRRLKALAKELGVVVILLSQLNREVEKRQDKRPLMSDLRESGSIEQDADIIVMMYRDEYYHQDTELKGIAEALIRKNRNGTVGVVGLAWEGSKVRFANLGGAWSEHGE